MQMQIPLHSYQVYAKNFMLQHPFCGLFLQMGLGKTSIVLEALWELNPTAHVLVIAPKTIARCTWLNEIEKWEDLLKYLKSLKSRNYIVASQELAPTTGHPHIHVYIQFNYPTRLSMKKLCGAHIELCYASPQRNIDYVKKDGNILIEEGKPRLGAGNAITIKEVKAMTYEDRENLSFTNYVSGDVSGSFSKTIPLAKAKLVIPETPLSIDILLEAHIGADGSISVSVENVNNINVGYKKGMSGITRSLVSDTDSTFDFEASCVAELSLLAQLKVFSVDVINAEATTGVAAQGSFKGDILDGTYEGYIDIWIQCDNSLQYTKYLIFFT